MKHNQLLPYLLLALGIGFSAIAQEGPPMANGVIADASLTQDPAGVRAKATATITTFMSKGAQVCDDKGQNCHSAFGQGGMDFNGVQSSAQRTLNVQSFSFSDPGGSNNVSAQLGTLALSCGDYRTKSVAGVAFKLTGCTVNSNGDAQVSYRVCTAPARGLSVSQPANGMECSDDPTQPNFRPKPGMVCLKAACDTEPEGSLNGWSPEQTSVFTANLPASASAQEVSNNGLGLVFYPSLSGGVPADYRADSDNMTAVKVVQTFVNSSTDQAAVGLKIAFRQKTQLTKEKIAGGVYSTPNPREHTAAWDTITKLQGNARIPQLQAKYASKGTKCIQQIQSGLGNDGKVTVCEEDYESESGVKPLARTAQVAAEGQNCASTAQCLQEVVNTQNWQQKCRSDVPLAIRKCSTTREYELSTRTFTRTANTDICTETRTQYTFSCVTEASEHGITFKNLSYAENVGYGVPAWSAATFAKYLVLDSEPRDFILNYFQIDNNGQLWINDVLVYSNVPWDFDARYGYIGLHGYGGGDYHQIVLPTVFDSAGNEREVWGDHGCNPGCRGLNPNMNITPYMKKGNNKIEIACYNANGAGGPCAFSIKGSVLDYSGAAVVNTCSIYEASK